MIKNDFYDHINRIKDALPESEKDIEIRLFKSIDSTNTEAKRAIRDGLKSDAIFIADEQTSGRGRRGKSFYSPSSKGLYFTAVLHPDVTLSDSVSITSAAAVAVVECIRAITKKDPMIKWVNDIFLDGKKICGILVEAVNDHENSRLDAIVIGIGINLTTNVFPDEIKDIAGSLSLDIDRYAFAAKLFARLKAFCMRLPDKAFMNDYRKYSLILGKTVFFSRNGKDYVAKAESITDDGELEVITADSKRMLLNSGEISIRPEQLF